MRFIVGLDEANWPTAIPIDRVREIRIDPVDTDAILEFRDDPTTSQRLGTCLFCDEVDLQNCMRILMPQKGKR